MLERADRLGGAHRRLRRRPAAPPRRASSTASTGRRRSLRPCPTTATRTLTPSSSRRFRRRGAEGRRPRHQFQQRGQSAGARHDDRRLQSDDEEAHDLRRRCRAISQDVRAAWPDDGDDDAEDPAGSSSAARRAPTARPAPRAPGCLIVLDANGKVAGVIANDGINMPWGNMAAIDEGDSATLVRQQCRLRGRFAGRRSARRQRGDGAPHQARRSRTASRPTSSTRPSSAAASARQPNKDVFLIGPTGLALGPDDTLYVSDATGNRINAIWDATTRDHSAGVGRTVTKDGLLQRPLAMAFAPNGHLLVINAQNGQVVEIDPASGDQIKRALDRPQQGAEAAGQRRPVRHRDDARPATASISSRTRRTRSCWRNDLPVPRAGAGPRGAACSPAPAACWRARASGALARAATPDALRRRPRRASRSSARIRAASPRAQQTHSYFAAFDLLAKTRDDLVGDAAALDRGRGADDARATRLAPLGRGPLGRRRRTAARRSGLAPVAADHHLRLRRRAVHQGRRRPLRPCRQAAGGARRPAEIQRRPVEARAHRRRPLGAGLRRRPAGRFPRGART